MGMDRSLSRIAVEIYPFFEFSEDFYFEGKRRMIALAHEAKSSLSTIKFAKLRAVIDGVFREEKRCIRYNDRSLHRMWRFRFQKESWLVSLNFANYLIDNESLGPFAMADNMFFFFFFFFFPFFFIAEQLNSTKFFYFFDAMYCTPDHPRHEPKTNHL